jgi:hypothetical protein
MGFPPTKTGQMFSRHSNMLWILVKCLHLWDSTGYSPCWTIIVYGKLFWNINCANDEYNMTSRHKHSLFLYVTSLFAKISSEVTNFHIVRSVYFYLRVLHPVAHLSNWFLMVASIATKFQYINSPFIFLLTHYMFRPLQVRYTIRYF